MLLYIHNSDRLIINLLIVLLLVSSFVVYFGMKDTGRSEQDPFDL